LRYLFVLLFLFISFNFFSEDIFETLNGQVSYIRYISLLANSPNAANTEYFKYGNEVYFNKNKKIIKRIFSKELGNIINKELQYNYDINQRLNEEIYIINGKYSYKKVYRYTNNRIIEIKKINDLNEIEILESYNYSENFTKCEIIIIDQKENKIITKKIIFYDTNKIIKEEYYYGTSNIPDIIFFEYDSDNNMIRRIEKNKNGEIIEKEYKYDENNNLIKKVYKGNNKKIVTLYKYIIFDEQQNWIEREIYINGKFHDKENRIIKYFK